MTTLSTLGLDSSSTRLMLVSAPDSVLAEAGAMKPRPSFASTLQVAEPTARMAWWPERRLLDAATVSRFAWMLRTASGEGWIIVDPAEEEALGEDDVREALTGTDLLAGESRPLATGEIALHVTPIG